MKRVWLAGGRLHEAVISLGRYGSGPFKDRDCYVGVTPEGKSAHADTHEEVMDALSSRGA